MASLIATSFQGWVRTFYRAEYFSFLLKPAGLAQTLQAAPHEQCCMPAFSTIFFGSSNWVCVIFGSLMRYEALTCKSSAVDAHF